MKKKILLIVENFENIFILLFINRLSLKYNITILTSKNNIPDHLKNNKFIKIKKNNIEKVIEKICNYFSNYHGSHKQIYYLKFQIDKEKNLTKKLFLHFKYYLSSLKILPKIDTLLNFSYTIYKKKYEFLKKFDFLIYDFRVNDQHNYSKRIIYSSKFYPKLKRISWVYSWDNSFIYHSILKSDYFLVWSKKLKKILHERHRIPEKKILINYPIQFEYIKKINLKKNNTLLFCCSYGSSKKDAEKDTNLYIKDDIEMIKHIHNIIKVNKLKIKIKVRLYPSTHYVESVKELKKLKNLKIDLKSYNFFNKKKFNYNNIKNHLAEKNYLMNNSMAIFTFGSTVNIEAARLDKPVFHIDYSTVNRKNNLYKYENFQKNIEDYVFLKSVKKSNVIKNEKEMKKVLIDLSKRKFKNYLKYSENLKKIFFYNKKFLY